MDKIKHSIPMDGEPHPMAIPASAMIVGIPYIEAGPPPEFLFWTDAATHGADGRQTRKFVVLRDSAKIPAGFRQVAFGCHSGRLGCWVLCEEVE